MIVSKAEIIEISFTYETSDESLIKDHKIDQIELELVRDVLGEEMWVEVRDQVLTGTTLTDENKHLYDNYIKYIIAYGVYADLVPSLYYQSSSTGIQAMLPENSQNDTKAIKLHREQAISSYKHHQEEMIKYICDNDDDYPLYDSSDQRDSKRVGGIIFY